MPARSPTACAVTFAGVLHGLHRDSRPAPNAALPTSVGAPMVQMKNRVSGLLMETGVSHNKRRLHRVGYFRGLMANNENIDESIRPLLQLSRDTITRLREDRICPGPFSAARSVADGESPTAQNGSGSWADHRPDVGAGDGRYFEVPVDPAGHQLLRALRG